MTDDLPSEFDLIVIGTGFPESCVAAAASRIGKTVLHIDPNEFYGGAWSSFGLVGLNSILELGTKELQNGSYKWHIQLNKPVEEAAMEAMEVERNMPFRMPHETIDISQSVLVQESRRFNLDLCPKILYSAGKLVQLLISSNICRYAEFRAVDRVCTNFRGEILNVPCSRSDVFNSKDLTMVEKRLLMKFLTTCMSFGEQELTNAVKIYSGKTFREYLEMQKVTPKLSSCVMQAIAMCSNNTSFEDGMRKMRCFLSGLGRYGNTPFLFPMYGCGEIPQCFCRLCAVFGGVYCLKRRVVNMSIDSDAKMALLSLEGKNIRAKHVVSSHGNLPESLCHSESVVVNQLSRGIFITATPLGREDLNTGGGGVNLLRLVSAEREAILIQLSHYSGTCPQGFYVFHLTTKAISNMPEADLQPFISQVFNRQPTAPKLLYSAFFTLTARKINKNADTSKSSEAQIIYTTAAPYYELDYDRSIENARYLFTEMYGNAEFLPRAPDPEEIIVEGEDPCALNANNLDEDLRAHIRSIEAAMEGMHMPKK